MEAFLSGWILPALAGILVTVFTYLLLRQYLERRKVHQLAWTIGFAMWAAATFMELAAVVMGHWTDPLYRLYIVTTTSLVPVLGYGTIRLISRRGFWGWGYLAINVVLVGVLAFGVFTVALDPAELAKGSVASYAALGAKGTFPRIWSAFVSIPAALVLFYGAILSIFRFMRKTEYAYRMWANVLIAVATVVIAMAGSLAAFFKTSLPFYLLELVSAGLYLWGFLLASTLSKGAAQIKERRAAEAAGMQASESAAGEDSAPPAAG